MKLIKILLLTALLLLVLLAGSYFVYTTTPLYAFQDAYIAYRDNDIAKFARRVDVDQIVESFLNDLLIEPAQSTPDLSDFQKQVGMGAVEMAKASISREIKRKMRAHFAWLEQKKKLALMQNLAGLAAFAQDPPAAAPASNPPSNPVSSATADVKQLLHATGSAMASEMGKMKEEAYERMQKYLSRHPETLSGRLMGKRANQEEAVQAIITEFGLTPSNLKGIGSYSVVSRPTGGEIAHVGFNFRSPKCDDYVLVEVELVKRGNNAIWQIYRFSNVKEVLVQLGEDHPRDIHNLLAYSLAGIGSERMKGHMHNMGESIKQNEAAKTLLDKWKIKL